MWLKNFKNKRNLSDGERHRWKIWRNIVQVYHEFSAQSTIHGIKYTTQAETKIGRCLWIFVVSLSMIAATLLAGKFYESHQTANMRTLIVTNQYPSWKLELPAITFCHSDVATLHRWAPHLISKNRIRMPFGITVNEFRNSLKFLSMALYPSNQFEKELRVLQRVLQTNDMTVADLFRLFSPKCSDYMVLCQFEGHIKDCESIIAEIYTPYGICCTFNFVPNVTKTSSPSAVNKSNTTDTNYYTVTFGGRYILSFLMKSYGPDDRISSMMYGDGIKVLIHEQHTYPGPSAREFVAPTGHETVARLYGRRLTANPDIINLKPTERDCFYSAKTYMYRAENCFMRCRDQAFFRLCGCLPFFSYSLESNIRICNFTDTSCLTRIKKKAFSLTLRNPECRCLPDCENTIFSLFTTTVRFNAPQFTPSKFYQTARSLTNATAIHITYSEQSSVLQKRDLVLSWINLVSSLGGVFSLFLGCSFISIIEIVYFFVIVLAEKLRNTHPQNTGINQQSKDFRTNPQERI